MRTVILNLFLGCTMVAGPLAAQETGGGVLLRSPILTIDQDRLFTDSRFGQALVESLEAESAALAAENRRIEAELIAEERALTERRTGLPAEEFRALAEAFDAKVVEIRRAQDTKSRALNQRSEADRQAFYRQALPLVAEIVRERGAVVVLERGAVILSAEQVDITDEAIQAIDRTLGTEAIRDMPAPPPANPDDPPARAE
ncbi:periplasmic chaperone for outer membrane proteins Skp [Rhodovulum marinum]|uniref:Periplasmic chaperone for outer membrane proteins Skp n=2 Tax=Rhodovulum marinum TaxID=320662 RepID=A0A4R2Q2T4_9RHOB|nr:periplasmic chaperone for outer membrane proteins Skp [Rhodovulum marinum]